MNQSEKEESTVKYIQRTAKKFLDRETAGGLLLILTTIIALLIGNSHFAKDYHHYLEDEFLFEFSEFFTFGLTVEEWINDGLMAIFFLVAGLELKREVLVGELSSFKKASMPLFGAIGGMVIPALIFVSFNVGTESSSGWGIPMATDIAYSLGIIGLLGKRIPAQLKVFLVALAIADDLGAILIIAFFYSNELNLTFLGGAAVFFLLLILLNRGGVKHLFWFLLAGVGLWYCFLYSGIHPTIAGVLLAMAIPVKPAMDSEILKKRVEQNAKRLEELDIQNRDPLQDARQREVLKAIKKDAEKSRPPLLRLENSLIDFNSFFIIPVFAFANAGVKLDLSIMEVLSSNLGLGILLGLGIGKVFGISFFSFIGHKLGVAQLDPSLKWQHIIGMAMIAGIGFTMSLFITNLAFADPGLIKIAKISILFASLFATVSGMIILLLSPSKEV